MIVDYIFNVLGPDTGRRCEIRQAWVRPERIALISLTPHQVEVSSANGGPPKTVTVWHVFIDGQFFMFLDGPWRKVGDDATPRQPSKVTVHKRRK